MICICHTLGVTLEHSLAGNPAARSCLLDHGWWMDGYVGAGHHNRMEPSSRRRKPVGTRGKPEGNQKETSDTTLTWLTQETFPCKTFFIQAFTHPYQPSNLKCTGAHMQLLQILRFWAAMCLKTIACGVTRCGSLPHADEIRGVVAQLIEFGHRSQTTYIGPHHRPPASTTAAICESCSWTVLSQLGCILASL